MPIELLVLAPSEVRAAALLANSHSIQVRARCEDVPDLERAGFVEAPAAVEFFLRAPVELTRYPRLYRKKLRRSLDAWASSDLRLRLAPMAEFGVERFLDQIYFPLFVRTMYERGIAPHHANQLRAMQELVRGDCSLAVVTTRGGTLAGAALVRPGRRDRFRHPLRGPLPDGDWDEGLVYALAPEFAPCRRALMLQLAEVTATLGRRWLSLGRDLAWCEEGYDGVLYEKLHLADSVVAAFGESCELYSWRPSEHDRFLFLAWDRERMMLRPRIFGAAGDVLHRIANDLESPRDER